MSSSSSLVVIAALSVLIVRRELRPLERTAVAADRIAADDFDLRLHELSASHTAPSNEVGRLTTALDRMLDEIQASFKARDGSEERLRQFVADASHELRTPLQSIRGYGELYQKGVPANTSDLDQAIGRMLSEVARMPKLVDELLTLARLDQFREADLDHVDFSRVVSDSCRDARAVEPHRPRRDLITEGITVLGDEAQLRRLVANLLGHVCAHTPPNAPCLVELVRVKDQAVLRVTDEGPGIPAEALPHVFDRFYRADTSRSRSTGGTGLGLALCAAIVHAHHGRIAVHSSEGEGTSVEIRLSCVHAETDDG
ncbi:putative sensor histidine kinase TcrY [Streptomyces sp. enrichment culture]